MHALRCRARRVPASPCARRATRAQLRLGFVQTRAASAAFGHGACTDAQANKERNGALAEVVTRPGACGVVVVAIAVLYFAKPVLLPLAVAVLLNVVISPAVTRLERIGVGSFRIGRIGSVLVVAAAVAGVFAGHRLDRRRSGRRADGEAPGVSEERSRAASRAARLPAAPGANRPRGSGDDRGADRRAGAAEGRGRRRRLASWSASRAPGPARSPRCWARPVS